MNTFNEGADEGCDVVQGHKGTGHANLASVVCSSMGAVWLEGSRGSIVISGARGDWAGGAWRWG